MASIIDSLVVLLNLDSSAFKQGSKDVDKSLKDTKDNAGRTAKELEAKGKVAAQFFGQIRNQVIALAAVFTAGAGLKSFVENVTTADAAVGRTARNIGMTTEALTAWQGVAERAGGTATGIAGSMQGLSQQFQQLALTGQSAVVPYFRAVGVALIDASGKMRSMDSIFDDLADKFHGMDPARAQALGRGMGIDEGTINVLMLGSAALKTLRAEQEKLGRANAADAAAAAKRQSQYRALTQASEDLGRKLLTALTPAISAVVRGLTGMAEWFSAHPNIFGAFVAVVGVAAAALTVALNVLAFRGFMGLVSAMFKVPAAAAAASAGMETAAAASSSSLLRMLGGLAKGAALLAAAGAVGYAIGTAIYTAIESTPLADRIGRWIAKSLALFGNEEAKAALAAEERSKIAARTAKGKVHQDPERFTLGLPPQRDRDKQPAAATGASPAPPRAQPAQRRADAEADDRVDTSYDLAMIDRIGRWIVKGFAALGEIQVRGIQAVERRSGPAAARQAAPGYAPAAVPSAKQRAQAEYDIQKFIGMGWTRAQAAGLAANLQRESAGNEKAVGDNGQAFGLAQWHKDRQLAFEKWAGKSMRESNRDEQLAFVNYELREGSERKAGINLMRARDPASAAAVVSRQYERPADTEGEAAKRASIAVSLTMPNTAPPVTYAQQQPVRAVAPLTTLLQPGPKLDPAMQAGAAAAVASNTTNNTTSSQSHTETTIGQVNVTLPAATDAQSVAQGLGPALKKNFSLTAQANYGLS